MKPIKKVKERPENLPSSNARTRERAMEKL
jgi:hypothetical protein